MLQGISGQVSRGTQTKLVHYRHFVKDGGLDRKAEGVRDLLGRSPHGDQLEDFALPQSQTPAARVTLLVRYGGGHAVAQ